VKDYNSECPECAELRDTVKKQEDEIQMQKEIIKRLFSTIHTQEEDIKKMTKRLEKRSNPLAAKSSTPHIHPFFEQKSDIKISDVEINIHGDKPLFPFGPEGWDWRVLDKDLENGKILLLSDKIVEKHNYHDEREEITWADCELQKYLNDPIGDFLSQFTPEDIMRIEDTHVITNDNPWFTISNGGSPINNKIFLLSIEEVVRYFGDSGQLEKPQNDYAIIDAYSKYRRAKGFDGASSWWWLRSPGYYNSYVASVYNDGYILVSGNLSNDISAGGGGIRPALWLKL